MKIDIHCDVSIVYEQRVLESRPHYTVCPPNPLSLVLVVPDLILETLSKPNPGNSWQPRSPYTGTYIGIVLHAPRPASINSKTP